jgi:pyruvate, water dikinase
MVCPVDDNPLGPACVQRIAEDTEFDAVSIGPTGVQHWERATKFMVPSDASSPIPPLVQNAARYPVHLDFLQAEFMPDLELDTYTKLIMLRASRQYYAGNLVRIEDPAQGTLYGFTIYASATSAEALEPVEVRSVYEQLQSVLTAGPLAYTFEPFDALGPEKAKAWISPGFPIWFPKQDGVTVEVYTEGTSYGRVRRLTADDFSSAATAETVGFRDIVVLDSVPFDIEPIVAAAVTGGRQWELSHVNVRMGRRGTPNLFVADALDAFEPWDNELVRLDAIKGSGTATPDSYAVSEATEAEAEAWWAAHRPHLSGIAAVDPSYTDLDTLTEMDVDDSVAPLVTRFGGKASNLAGLYAFLDAQYQVPGFGIPFADFEAFLDANSIQDERQSPAEEVTLREYVERLAADTTMSSDAAYRARLLAALRARIEDATVPPALVNALCGRIDEVFGGTDVRVRFRSSSNIEDGLEFSGAGLYDSTTVCADDSLDQDSAGPSECDSNENDERSVERGLRKVWASLFNDRAWAERDWYQVPQDAASMAILVTLGFPDELANGVAFTGDPSDPAETRFLINAQLGDTKVVSADPSMIPEKDLLEITEGEVSWIYRVRSSTLAEPGSPVLSDAQLQELGTLMASIQSQYPVDLEGHAATDVLLDMEFKIQQGTDQLKLKQIRPFLRGEAQ